MPIINIGSTPIDIPESGTSPDWAPAMVQFMEAVAAQLAITTGPFDVPAQVFSLDPYNSASNIDITGLSFPTDSVRAVFIKYAVYRTTDSANAYEAGDMIAMFNPNNSVGQKWALSRGNITGSGGLINFNITDLGQFQFSTTALAGSGHTGKLSFDGRAQEQL